MVRINNHKYTNAISLQNSDPIFNAYSQAVQNQLKIRDQIDPYSTNPTISIDEKVNSFLSNYAGMDFSEFVHTSQPNGFSSGDYEALVKPSLKLRLFNYRAKIMITALADCISQGIPLQDIVRSVKDSIIKGVKPIINEPTFEAILKVIPPY